MAREIEDKDERISSLEEELRRYKSDHDNIKKFRECEKGVRTELHNLEKIICMQVFRPSRRKRFRSWIRSTNPKPRTLNSLQLGLVLMR
jgi:hypothetical protein